MGDKQYKTNGYTDFFYYAFRNILLVSIPFLTISALILGLSIPHSSARVSSSDSLAISVPSSCTLSNSVDEVHSASIINGTYRSDIGTTTLSTFCNDKNGYSVYAIGDSLNSEGNNTLVGSNGSNINSGTATSGDTSNWAMKLSLKAGDTSPTPPTIISPFNSYSTVPTTWTKVATIPFSTTDMEKGSNFTTTYATYISPTQAAGTYLGQVKYLLTHPSATEPGTNYFIMQEVANWKNDLDEEESVQAIDIRDGKVYWVTKLKDGNVWMTQNLDLDLIANHTYTHADTDLGWDPSDPNPNAIWTVDNDRGTVVWDNTNSKFTGWVGSNTLPSSGDPGEKYYYTSNTTNNDTTFDTITQCLTAGHSRIDCQHYSAGNYYNWTAAVASNDSISITSDNAPNSICPAGWRLPDTLSNEYAQLLMDYNIIAYISDTSYMVGGFNAIRSTPLYFVRSGVINNNGSRGESNLGLYWSKTVAGAYYARTLRVASDSVRSTSSDSKASGWSVRCVAR